MLSTIMISLLCIWIAILIIGQVIGAVVAYDLYKLFSAEKK